MLPQLVNCSLHGSKLADLVHLGTFNLWNKNDAIPIDKYFVIFNNGL